MRFIVRICAVIYIRLKLEVRSCTLIEYYSLSNSCRPGHSLNHEPTEYIVKVDFIRKFEVLYFLHFFLLIEYQYNYYEVRKELFFDVLRSAEILLKVLRNASIFSKQLQVV